MKIIGIDPGTARIGWAVVEENTGKIKSVSYGCVETDKEYTAEKRILKIYENLQSIMKIYSPAEMSVEDLFFTNNAKTAISVGQARGVILLCAAQANIPVYSYSPLNVKMSLCGYGKADKQQVQHMVTKILNLKNIPKPDDAADALAIAVTHAAVYKITSALNKNRY